MTTLHTYYTRANAWLAKHGPQDPDDIAWLSYVGIVVIFGMCLMGITP